MNKQGTEEWLQERIGKVTASNFGLVITNGRGGKPSKTVESYMIKILSEMATGTSDSFSNTYMDWGTENEVLGRYEYEKRQFTEVQEVGFMRLEQEGILGEYVGGSPDGLVGKDGLIEIKCPKSTTFLEYFYSKEIPKNYIAQMQGLMWILDREWCDYVVYDPRMLDYEKQIIITRVEKDQEYINKLTDKLTEFCTELDKRVKEFNLNI